MTECEQVHTQMRVETLHAPHGRDIESWVCPKCLAVFPALCLYLDHQRKQHGDVPINNIIEREHRSRGPELKVLQDLLTTAKDNETGVTWTNDGHDSAVLEAYWRGKAGK